MYALVLANVFLRLRIAELKRAARPAAAHRNEGQTQLMSQTRRSVPDPEWLQMHRSGIPTPKIAATAGAAETTVRYHLAIAARQDPGLRTAHKPALSKPQRLTAPGLKNQDDILALYKTEGRLPAKSADRERALASWLHGRRKDAADGSLSPAYARALDTIPSWRAADQAGGRRGPVDAAPGRGRCLPGRRSRVAPAQQDRRRGRARPRPGPLAAQ
jgi:hypothetical protein